MPDPGLVVVVGVGSGLGGAIAKRFATEGYAVAMAARTTKVTAAIASEIEAAGGTARGSTADARDEASMRQLFDDAEAAFGPVGVAVFNVGDCELKGFLEIDAAELEQTWRLNCLSAFLMAKEAAGRMAPREAAAARAAESQRMLRKICATLDHLNKDPRCSGRAGIMGFAWAGALVNDLAVTSNLFAAHVIFYPQSLYELTPEFDNVDKITTKVQFHFADDVLASEKWPPHEAALRAAGVDYEGYVYKGAKHGFFNDSRDDRYHPAAAEKAWARSIGLFKEALAG